MISRRYTQEGTELAVKCHKMDKNKFANILYLRSLTDRPAVRRGMNVEKERLNKYLASCGVFPAERRTVLIEEDALTVNGATALPECG